GSAPMAPIARWFFDQPITNRNHWNQAFLLEVPAAVDRDFLDQALRAVTAHHDAFRLRCRETFDGWECRYVDAPQPAALERVDLSDFPTEILASAIDSHATRVQAGLDVTSGPIVRAVLFECGPVRPARLLIAIHHVAVDGVSWRVFLEDVEAAYLAVSAGGPPECLHRTTSPKVWAERLVGYADTNAKDALAHWPAMCDESSGILPCDHEIDAGLNTEASASTITVTLTPAETDALLHRVPTVYGTQINDVLLSALAKTLAYW